MTTPKDWYNAAGSHTELADAYIESAAKHYRERCRNTKCLREMRRDLRNAQKRLMMALSALDQHLKAAEEQPTTTSREEHEMINEQVINRVMADFDCEQEGRIRKIIEQINKEHDLSDFDPDDHSALAAYVLCVLSNHEIWPTRRPQGEKETGRQSKYQQALQHADTQHAEFKAEALDLLDQIGHTASHARHVLPRPGAEPDVESLRQALDNIEEQVREAREALATAAGAARDAESLRNGALSVFKK